MAATDLSRIENWDIALFRFVEVHEGEPFEWGRTDCATLARGGVAAMYGEDLLPDLPIWRSQRGALKASRRLGPIIDALKALGAERVSIRFAQSGDILIPDPDEDGLPRLAIVWNAAALCSSPEHGVTLVPLAVIPRGTPLWRLPNAH